MQRFTWNLKLWQNYPGNLQFEYRKIGKTDVKQTQQTSRFFQIKGNSEIFSCTVFFVRSLLQGSCICANFGVKLCVAYFRCNLLKKCSRSGSGRVRQVKNNLNLKGQLNGIFYDIFFSSNKHIWGSDFVIFKFFQIFSEIFENSYIFRQWF